MNIVQAALQKPSISIADSVDLRVLINLLYMMTEILRNFAKTGSPELQRAAESLADDLAGMYHFYFNIDLLVSMNTFYYCTATWITLEPCLKFRQILQTIPTSTSSGNKGQNSG